MSNVIVRTLLVFSCYVAVHCYTETLTVDDGTCGTYEINHVNEDHNYQLTWRGGKIPNFCSFGFIGRDSGYDNEYKVCVEAIGFKVTDCNVKLKYKTGVSGHLKETYSCGDDTVSKFCGDSDDFVDVHFDTEFGVHLKPNPGQITLKVTGTMTYNYSSMVRWIAGGVVISLLVISSIITGIVCIVRRRQTPGAIYRNTSSPTVAQTNVYTNGQAMPSTVVQAQAGVQGLTGYAQPPPPYHQVVTTSGNATSVTLTT